MPPTDVISGGEEALRFRSCAALRVQQRSRVATFAASGVRPNPSLSRDPTRQAAWAARRLGLCCTAPPKRLAARVAVSSNVRPRKPNAKTATPSRFGAKSVIEQIQQRSFSGVDVPFKEAREPSHAPDAPLRSEERPGGRSNQQPRSSAKHRRQCNVAHGAHEHEHERERVSVPPACTTRGHGSESTSPRLHTLGVNKPARHLCSSSCEA